MAFRSFDAVEADEKRPPNLCSCGCGQALEPRIDGERHKIDGKEVNEDCYFDSFGRELDQHPIGVLRVIRGA